MIRKYPAVVAIAISSGVYADYIPEKMPICFDGAALKNYADYVEDGN